MSFLNNTIQGRIALGYLTLTAVLVAIVFISFRSVRHYNDVKNLQAKVYQFNTAYHSLNNKCHEVIFLDAFTEGFHKELAEGRPLEMRHDLAEFKHELNELLTGDYHLTSKLEEEYAHIKIEIDALNQDFEVLLMLFGKRGFKDYGMIGKMRDDIHDLENSQLEISDVLQLRRYEKDYFIRKDSVYIDNLISLSNELLGSIPNKGSDYAMLADYQKMFLDIVRLDREIGSKSSGLIGDMLRRQEALEEYITQFQLDIDYRSDDYVADLYKYQIAALAACFLIAVIFSVFTPKIIIKPINDLAAQMKAVKKSGFTKEIREREEATPTKEIERLVISYEDLLKEVRTQISRTTRQNDELIALNNQLKLSEAKAQELSKLKDKFFSIVSHDIRSPLANAVGVLALLDRDPNSLSGSELRSMISMLREKFDVLQGFLEDLLTWSKNQMNSLSLEYKPVDTLEVINKSLALYAKSIENKKIKFDIVANTETKFTTDFNTLDFIIRNIISNAVKFTPKGGSILVLIDQVKEGKRISVKDTGVGLTDDQIKMILSEEAMYTTKGTNDELGSGLGISLIREFLSRLNGHLDIYSKKEEGSTFTVILPDKSHVDALSA